MNDDNSPQRLIDVFFYGLYQDSDILHRRGGQPRDPRPGRISGHRLRLGHRGSVVREADSVTWGMVFALTHAELQAIYEDAGLSEYRPEPVMVTLLAGGFIPALCYVTLNPAAADETNPDYLAKLRKVMAEWGLPTEQLENA